MSDAPQADLINPNTADVETLTELPGVGETLARRIQAARPYDNVEDLARVAGLGSKALDRIAPRLNFAPAPDSEAEPPEQEEQAPASRPSTTAGPSSIALVLASSVLTGLLSVGLTLGLLLAINGTLNMGRHRDVQALAATTAELDSDTAELERRLASIDERLAALEGLSGRMRAVEGEVEGLRADTDAAVADVAEMRQNVTALQQTARQLSLRVERFDEFLDGLRDLLIGPETDAAPTPEAGE